MLPEEVLENQAGRLLNSMLEHCSAKFLEERPGENRLQIRKC